MQGLNNARAILTGSLDFFSDEIFTHQEYSNKNYVEGLINWTFKKSGILRVESMTYHGEGSMDK